MLVSGKRTKADLKLNPELDQKFMHLACNGRLAEVDDWEPQDVIEKGGIGWMELHTWLAASSAHEAAGGALPVVDFYAEMLEIGIANGVMHG